MATTNTPAYQIKTDRIVLRCWSPQDATHLFSVIEDNVDHLERWMPWFPSRPQDVFEQAELLRVFRGNFDLGRELLYGAFDRRNGALVGGIGLHGDPCGDLLEIGYWISKDFTKRGFATEITAALVHIGFKVHKVKILEIHCSTENRASERIPKKLGFVQEATLSKRLCYGEYRDDVNIWTMFADGFESSAAKTYSVTAFGCIGQPLL